MAYIIHILNCRGLQPKGRFSKKIDPYVKLYLGQQPKQKTKTIKNCTDPNFDETFRYSSWNEDEMLRVSVWSHDRLSQNQCIGEIFLPYPNDPTGVHQQEYGLLQPSTSRRSFTSAQVSPTTSDEMPTAHLNSPLPGTTTSSSPALTPQVVPRETSSFSSKFEEKQTNVLSKDENVSGYITVKITNAKQQENYLQQMEDEKKEKEKLEKEKLETQMRLAREELETRKEQERQQQDKQQKEHSESDKKRPILSIEMPEILKGKNSTPTIVHTSPHSTKGTSNSKKKDSEINTGKEETPMIPHPATKEEPCCIICYKDLSCLIL